MKRIGLLSDTHSYLDPKIFEHFDDCDEIWHAGDFGSKDISEKLTAFKPLKGVHGNIDNKDIQLIHPKDERFTIEGFDVWITHIGGYPGHYAPDIKKKLKEEKLPNIFICGHSHILRVMADKTFNNMLCLNPGAAGKEGFHKIRTIMKFDLDKGKIENMKAIELGKR